MADQDININVNVTGDAEAEARIARLGVAGSKSLGELETGAVAASKSLTQAGTAGAAAAAALRQGFSEAGQPIAAASNAVGGFLGSIGALGGKVRALIPTIGGLNDANDQAGASAGAANLSLVKLGQTMRLLGRAARVHELSILGRSLGVVGRAAALAVPAIAIAGLAKLASGAVAAAEAFANFQGKLGLSNAAAGRLQSVGAALGLGIDKTQGSFEALGKLVGEASDKEKENATAAASLKSQYNDAVGALSGFDKETKQLAKSSTELNLKLASGTITTKEFLDEQTKLKEEQKAHNKAVGEAVQKANDLAIAQVKQRGEAIANQNVLQKLNVTLTDNKGKLINSEEAFTQLAGAMERVVDPAKREKIEQDLIAAGIDRNLLPALRRGAKGFEELVATGKLIRPPFTEAQIKAADDFSIASGRAGQALASIVDQIGISVAPGFTQFLETVAKLLVDNRTEIVAFATQIGSVLLPVLQEMGTVITGIITIIGNFERGLNIIGDAATAASKKLREFLGLKEQAGKATPLGPTAAASHEDIIGSNSLSAGSRLALQLTKDAGTAQKAVVAVKKEIATPPPSTAGLDVSSQILKDIGFTQQLQQAFDNGAAIIKQTAVGLWQSVVQTFQAGAASVGPAWDLIKQLANGTWDLIKQGANQVWETIKGVFNDGLVFMEGLWELIKQIPGKAWDFIVAKGQEAWASVKETANQVLADITGFFQPFIDKVKSAWEWVTKLAQAIAGLGSAQVGAGAGAVVGAAGGGYIRGPGTSTSDSILARLSKGEFVVRAAAVDKYGVQLMHAINSMRLPRSFPGFSMGGMIDAMQIRGPIPAYATGGEVSRSPSGSSINLHIDGETFNLLTRDEETATRLTRYATTRRMRSAGKKPGYYSA